MFREAYAEKAPRRQSAGGARHRAIVRASVPAPCYPGSAEEARHRVETTDMRWTAPLFALFLVAASGPALADDEGRLALARQVVEAAHAGDNMRALMPTFLGQMRQMLQAQAGGDASRVDDFLQRFQKRFDDGVPSFVDLVARVYAREFSDEDLAGLLSFYRSPTGQHLLGKQVAIAQGMAKVGAEWGQNMAREIIAEFQKEKGGAAERKL